MGCNCKIDFAWQCPNCNEINFVKDRPGNIEIKLHECRICKNNYTVRIIGIPWENKNIENMV